MTARKVLFLLGGGDAIFDQVAAEFVPLAGGTDARIALLLGGKPGWEDYVSQYAEPWIRRGVKQQYNIAPNDNGVLDLDTVSARINKATGIFIGGGDTPAYHRLYATEPVRSMIRDRYLAGVPVAGLSAGALIAPDICAIPPDDTGDDSVRIVSGLGLVSGLILGVHYTEWKALPHVVKAMAQTRTAAGIGIDEAACVILENGQTSRVLGRSAFKIGMTDFERETHTVANIT